MTFDKAIIDAQAAFAYGQVYVALSRCRSLEGLVLSTPLNTQSIRIDGNIISFTRQMENNPPDSNLLTTEKRGFQEMLLVDLFNFAILVRRHYYFLKILRDNVSSVNPEVIDLVEEITKVLKEDIDSVSNKFKPQLRSLLTQSDNAENNPQLKERLSKAANWFEEKLRVSVWDQINSLEIETDNKEVKKSTKDQLTKIKEDTYVKLECFKACFNGFNTKHFLEVKAKASIDDHLQKKPKKITNEKAYAAGSNPELYETLKQWRNKTADKEDVSVYMVIQLKTMNAICNLLPSSYLELKAIKGFGKKKLDKYGKEIFDIVADFRKGQGLATGVWDVSEKENKPKKIDTKQQSFQLFKSGLTVEEVARERGMITRTIEGHLAHFVGTGELKISEFVDDKKVEIVSEYLEENPNSRLAEAKAALGDDYSYSELAFVVKHLEFLSR